MQVSEVQTFQRCQEITAEWLKDMGLELKPEKTRLSHTLINAEEGNVGFNLLGFLQNKREKERSKNPQRMEAQ